MEELLVVNKITLDDVRYPEILRQLPGAPKVLYCRGNIELLGLPAIAVVGTRKPTSYGAQVTQMFVGRLAVKQVVISGLAYGIDALAHEATLAVGGKTIAVLAGGVDDATIYPARHLGLAHRILRNGGLIVSEHEEGVRPLRGFFPARNRIIAGLAAELLVIEAGRVSGTLITAQLALDYNREVWAVPGAITSPTSWGTNWLISQGAKPLFSLEQLSGGQEEDVALAVEKLDGAELVVYEILAQGPMHINEVAKRTEFDIPELSGILTLLELKKLVKNTGNGMYVRV